ncbi:substrate-binding domain-containing protein [Ruegeria sp.]|uniref:substrate-binding domain-containing protein n=1 Tax=Ruegeria sp. TaxID=1879320 RepID=UPI003B5CC7B7
MTHPIGRRSVLAGMASTAAMLASPSLLSAQSGSLKMGTFFSLTGPASLFGPTQTACTKLAVDQINAAGGILGRQVEVVVGDGGLSPAEAAQAALRMVLQDKVDFIVGSHNSAVRQSIIATIKWQVPYVYTPLYEGGECAPNTYVTADTPPQQVKPSLNALHEMHGIKKVYLIGNDYVWPQKLNERAKEYVAAFGGEIVGEEYAPLGPGNKFDDAVTRIKAAAPDLVFITLVGGDNVNFNRAFAGFGLDANIKRLSVLLEELTLQGIGTENSNGLYSSMSYFTAVDSPENAAFKADYAASVGADGPPLSMLGADAYSGVYCAAALLEAAGSNDAAAMMAASEGLSYKTATGTGTMTNRHVNKDIYLAECQGTDFNIVQTFAAVAHGETCSV